VIQSPSGRIPVKADPKTTLAQVVASIDESGQANSLRYLQTSVHRSQWETMTLYNLGLKSGARALLIMELNAAGGTTMDTSGGDVTMMDASSSSNTDTLQPALNKILNNNFDQDSQTCVVTLIKIIDNVIQKPNNPKVRSIRLANPAVAEKIVARGGGTSTAACVEGALWIHAVLNMPRSNLTCFLHSIVDYLLACGFVKQTTTPELLSKSDGEECLVLTEQEESTSHLVKARRLLMQTAIQDLGMQSDDLPRYKPPPAAVSVSSSTATTTGFNPYQPHRYNATGQPQQPAAYESTTETRLRQLQSRQERLEAQLQGEALTDRELVALRPNQQAAALVSVSNPTASGPSDGALLAQRMQRLEQERKEREEGGFTTKAMRDLQNIKKAKVYSHAKLRVQFPDGSAIEAKFLPKETVESVKAVVNECFTVSSSLEFDLYVAPPRRKLDVTQTLQQEGLVPAAKCFVSWKGGGPKNEFIKEELFQSEAAAPSFPTAKPVVQEAKKKEDSGNNNNKSEGGTAKKPSREDDLLRRMMGGSKGGGKAKKDSDSKTGKPKWFKG